jgi:hypothetical protein
LTWRAHHETSGAVGHREHLESASARSFGAFQESFEPHTTGQHQVCSVAFSPLSPKVFAVDAAPWRAEEEHLDLVIDVSESRRQVAAARAIIFAAAVIAATCCGLSKARFNTDVVPRAIYNVEEAEKCVRRVPCAVKQHCFDVPCFQRDNLSEIKN